MKIINLRKEVDQRKMKIVRNKVFETNSSSTHSITVPLQKDDNDIQLKGLVITVPLGEFGWEYGIYNDITSRLSYIYTAICQNYGRGYTKYIHHIEKLLFDKCGIQIIWDIPVFYVEEDEETYDDEDETTSYLDNGHIDHGYELKQWLEDLFSDDDLLLKTILYGEIRTSNDNNDNDDGMFSSITQKFVNNDEYIYMKGN